MAEKHTIRNAIIASVTSGIILSILLSAGLRRVLAACCHWVWSALTYRIPLPVWLLSIVGLLALFPVVQFVRFVRRRDEYTQDHAYGVFWRWETVSGIITGLQSFCPHCDMQLSYHEQRSDHEQPSYLYPPHFTQFVCERCGTRSDKLNGDRIHALGLVEREMERRRRTGEWQNHKTTAQGQ